MSIDDTTPANPAQVTDASEDRRQFKNFHRLLCERFGYTHDERDWFRDQVSLIEHIAAIGAGPVAHNTDAQIEHMVQRFLRWKLPDDFNPDGGISFTRISNVATPYEYRYEPVGTNVFDYKQAKAMVRHMLEGLPTVGAGGQTVAYPGQFAERVVAACRAYMNTYDVLADEVREHMQVSMSDALRASDALTHPAPSGQAVASPVSDDYFIQERDDDMLICAKHWQYGSICIARRPKLATNDEWRSTAQDIVNAVSAIAHPVQPGWRDMESAPKDGTRVLLVWKPFGGLSEHVELGKWKARQGWSNTYGHAFNGDPDAWAPLAPFALPAAPQQGE